MSPEFMRRAERVPASPDPDEATAQTVQLMCDQIARSAQDPLVRECAKRAVLQWRGGPAFALTRVPLGSDPTTNPRAIAESIWWWAKHQMKFVHHSKLIQVWLNEKDQLQLLIEPAVLVRMRRMQGDCAIYTMLICALLDCFNVPWEIVTLAVDPEQPTIFSHVFPRVVLPDGRIALDASHGRYPGWQVPRSRRFREQVWNENGEPIMNRGTFQGLHGYEFRGMGQDDGSDGSTTATLFDTTPSAIDYSTSLPAPTNPTGSSLDQLAALSQTPQAAALTDAQWNALFGGTSPTSIPSSGTSMPSQSSAAWAGVAATLAKGGMTLAQIEAIQPGEVVLPNGTVIGSGGSASLSSSLSSVPSYVWLLGGVALVAIFMMKR
jgi:hypothetical protein